MQQGRLIDLKTKQKILKSENNEVSETLFQIKYNFKMNLVKVLILCQC